MVDEVLQLQWEEENCQNQLPPSVMPRVVAMKFPYCGEGTLWNYTTKFASLAFFLSILSSFSYSRAKPIDKNLISDEAI